MLVDALKTILHTVIGLVLLQLLVIVFLCSLTELLIIKLFYNLFLSRPFHILWGLDAIAHTIGRSYFKPKECLNSNIYYLKLKGTIDLTKWRQTVLKSMFNASTDGTAYLRRGLTNNIGRKFGYLVWENDSNFSIDNHVRLYDDYYEDDHSLVNVVARIRNERFPKDHPAWEILLVPRKEEKCGNNEDDYHQSEYVAIIKFHHSNCDGSMIILWVANMCDDSAVQRFHGK